MNLVAAMFLTLALVVLPAKPAYGVVDASAGPAPAGHAPDDRPEAGSVTRLAAGSGAGLPRARGTRPAAPSPSGAARHGARAAHVEQAGPSHSSGVARSGEPGPSVYVPPVGGAHGPAGVARGFDPPHSAWGAGHRGVDLAAAAGAEVRSPGPGTVTFAGTIAGRGVVVVAHPDGLRSSLEPVTAAVPVGTGVTAGEPVGRIESPASGHCAPESCVHWGVRRGERYVDPVSLLRPERPVIVLLPDG